MNRITLVLTIWLFGLAGCQVTALPSGPRVSDPRPEAQTQNQPLEMDGSDLASLVEDSALVFVGTLADQATEKDERGLIITHNQFSVDEVLVGAIVSPTITLTTLGGTLGEESLRVSHLPIFVPGQQYIILTDPDRTTYDPVTGNTHGVFLVDPDQSQVYTYEGASVVGVTNGVVQLGAPTLADSYVQDPQGTGTQTENPVFQGEIVEMAPAETLPEAAPSSALSVEQFATYIQELGAPQ